MLRLAARHWILIAEINVISAGVRRRDGGWHFRLRLYKPYKTNKHRRQRQNHFTPSNRVHWSIRATNSMGREHSLRFVKNEQRSKRKVRNPKPFNLLPVTVTHPNHACQYTPLKSGTPKRYQTSVTKDSRAPGQWIRDHCGYIRRISTSNSGTWSQAKFTPSLNGVHRSIWTGNFLGGSDRKDVYNEKRSIRKVKMNPQDV